MHAEKATHALLLASAPLLAAVPAASIYPHIVAQGVALPALGVTFIDAIDLPVIDADAFRFRQARISVEVHAADYVTQKSVLELVDSALMFQRGTFAGVQVASIVNAGDGPDLRDDDPPIYRQSHDFLVTFIKP